MMSIDFIGPKYLKGSDNMINFLTCKYIRPGIAWHSKED